MDKCEQEAAPTCYLLNKFATVETYSEDFRLPNTFLTAKVTCQEERAEEIAFLEIIIIKKTE